MSVTVIRLEDHVTAREAAYILGYHPASVKNLCRWGKLPGAVKVGRDWLIPRAAVESYRPGPQGFAAHPELRGPGRAKKKEQ